MTDPLSSVYALSREERARLARMPADITLIERMVENHFEAQETEATFVALFGLLEESKVA